MKENEKEVQRLAQDIFDSACSMLTMIALDNTPKDLEILEVSIRLHDLMLSLGEVFKLDLNNMDACRAALEENEKTEKEKKK